ncbi:hypothetical protein Dda_1561 [Drechslerella dactyloides]|uniref:Uncharacterized protein n=1 Tax=Drechslerella dactyloides TaxID=74499 RepID=A0AAD6NN74_DREDA|nr:hypothetical protein Dda_1561 [Drechslerella dactyloides]
MPIYHIHVQDEPAQTNVVSDKWRPVSPTDLLPADNAPIHPQHLHHRGNRDSHRHKSTGHHRRPSLKNHHEDSWCTTCAQDGHEPGEREFHARPVLHHGDTFDSMFVEDGHDDGDARGSKAKIQELSDSSSSDEFARAPYEPPLRRTRNTRRAHNVNEGSDGEHIEHATSDNTGTSVMDVLFFYGFICILVVLLKSVPGLLSSFRGWDNWTEDDIGEADYDE